MTSSYMTHIPDRQYVAEKISAVFFDNFHAFSYIQYIIITRNNKWLLEFSFYSQISSELGHVHRANIEG